MGRKLQIPSPMAPSRLVSLPSRVCDPMSSCLLMIPLRRTVSEHGVPVLMRDPKGSGAAGYT